MSISNKLPIAMCNGKDCPIKEQCYRYKVTPNKQWQSYIAPPYDKERNSCIMFWDTKTTNLEIKKRK